MSVWNILCARNLLPYPSLDNASITNPDFANPTTRNAFDWHLEPTPGIRVTQARNGLHVRLSGTQPDSCVMAWQYVPLHIGTTYRLRPTGGEGLGWSVSYPSAGTWGELWSARSLRFEAPADVIRLVLAYRRRPAGRTRRGDYAAPSRPGGRTMKAAAAFATSPVLWSADALDSRAMGMERVSDGNVRARRLARGGSESDSCVPRPDRPGRPRSGRWRKWRSV